MSAPSFRPLYDQIKILITQSLIAGEWRPGEAIRSEMELASHFGESGTVRKAVDELAGENILVRKQGKGHLSRPMTKSTPSCALRIHADRGEKRIP
jgi:GntR family transcriptional regulator